MTSPEVNDTCWSDVIRAMLTNNTDSCNSMNNGSHCDNNGRPVSNSTGNISVSTGSGTTTVTAATTATVAAAPGTNASGNNNNRAKDPIYAPLYVSQRVLSAANIDNRRDDAVRVTFRINSMYPECPVVDRLHYRYDAANKQRLAACFLGKAGLNIVVPAIPNQLIQKGIIDSDGWDHQGQELWHSELVSLMNKDAKLMWDPRGDDDAKLLACSKAFDHLSKVNKAHIVNGKEVPPLFKPGDYACYWVDILLPQSQIIRSPSAVRTSPDNAGRSQEEKNVYELSLYTATAPATYIITCVLFMYSMLGRVAPGVTAAVRNILPMQDAPEQTSSGSDSGDDGEWQQRSSRNRRRRNNDKFKKKDIQRKLDSLCNTDDYAAASKNFKGITTLPLLALASTVSVRPLFRPYVSYIIDNFQSLGCDIHDLANDRSFARLKDCRQELRSPNAHWTVQPKIGNATASLIIREEYKDLVPQLNAIATTDLSIPRPALRIGCTVVKRNKQGQRIHDSQLKIWLTPPIKVEPPVAERYALPSSTSPASQPLPSDSYAARVIEGVRRAESLPQNRRARNVHQAQMPSNCITSGTPSIASVAPPNAPWDFSSSQLAQPTPTPAPRLRATPLPSAAAPAAVIARVGASGTPMLSSLPLPTQLESLEARVIQRMEERVQQIIESRMDSYIARTVDMLTNCVEKMIAKGMDDMSRGVERMIDQIALRLNPTSTMTITRERPEIQSSGISSVAAQGKPSTTQKRPRPHSPEPPHSGNDHSRMSSAPAGPALNGPAVTHE